MFYHTSESVAYIKRALKALNSAEKRFEITCEEHVQLMESLLDQNSPEGLTELAMEMIMQFETAPEPIAELA